MEGGSSLEEFLDGFPSVSRAQVIEFLEEARAQLTAATTETMRVLLDECLPWRLSLE